MQSNNAAQQPGVDNTPPATPMKKCSGCKIPKALEEFYKDARHKDGHYSRCKECILEPNRKGWELIDYDGQTHTMSEWARIKGLKPATLINRLRRGWPVEKALNTKTLKKRTY